MQSFDKIKKICGINTPYEVSNELDLMFVEAMRENIEWHLNRSEFYRKFLEGQGFSTSQLNGIEDLSKIPFILANFFKKHEILSIKREEVFLHLTSSGTTGQKSQIFFDEWSIRSAQKMVDWIYEFYGWVTPNQKCNYLLYTYEPEEGNKLGTAYTDNFLCKYAPVNRVKYALRYMGKGKEHKFDNFGVIETLRDYEREGLPVRIFGFPAFLYFTIKQMQDLGLPPIKLHPESFVFLGGGWKGNQDKSIAKSDLYKMANEVLGIPDKRLRDGFGSVEHCIPYVECDCHRFHVPVWSRVLIRDVRTLEEKKFGEVGYLNFISPYITSVPANNVLMGDLAILHAPHECQCGLPTPYFDIVGRAGISKGRSCAVAASELLKDM